MDMTYSDKQHVLNR